MKGVGFFPMNRELFKLLNGEKTLKTPVFNAFFTILHKKINVKQFWLSIYDNGQTVTIQCFQNICKQCWQCL